MKLKFLLFLLSVIILNSCKNVSNPSITDVSRITNNQTLIDSLMKVSYERGVFNGNILVAKNNKIIYQNEFGYSDSSKSKELNPNSIFNLGSIGKEFNAVAIMMLKEKGLLNLDDKISKFEMHLPEWSNTISINHLLQYTSGLPRVNWRSVKNEKDIFVDLSKIKQLKFKPGSGYTYSINNIILQRKIIEKVSGMSFIDFVQSNILSPSNMKDALIDPRSDNPQLATPFNNDFINDKPMDIEITGWVHPTVNDMYNWIVSLHSGKLISEESLNQLFNSFSESSEAALGGGKFKNNRLLIHQHQGSSFNYESFIHYNAKEDLVIVLMTNNKNFKLREIAESIENISKGNSFLTPQKSVYLTIRQKCYDDVNEGIQFYKTLKNNYPDTYNFSNETELNRVGYKLVEKNQIEDAIEIFTLNAHIFPKSSNAFDSLAEAYGLFGMTSESLKNYKISLRLNPNNINAKKQIERLKESFKN
ncbi:serine hydrolase domain-containing protein [Maribacter antarcticus]|uniref:serine hydrolase domain-containing protein n=1 Tax=Maribacter antarcticus TaxID=505250 RepID=UPI000688E90C|nr:serine hydrolase domain-containing protein [Maribacter antarcticus]